MMPSYDNDAVPANAPIAYTDNGAVQGEGPMVERPMLHVQWRVSLQGSTVNIERYVPLGETAAETIRHMDMLVTDPGRGLACLLVAAHFQAIDYATGQEKG